MRSNRVTRQVNFNRTKIGGKCRNWNTQMRHFGRFSNTVPSIFFLKNYVKSSLYFAIIKRAKFFVGFLHSSCDFVQSQVCIDYLQLRSGESRLKTVVNKALIEKPHILTTHHQNGLQKKSCRKKILTKKKKKEKLKTPTKKV